MSALLGSRSWTQEIAEAGWFDPAAVPEPRHVYFAGYLGCNQSKGSRNYVPSYRGLAFTHQEIDMNYVPVHERPFDWARAG
jgi:hypothetical protein